jgi:hypothetical protein
MNFDISDRATVRATRPTSTSWVRTATDPDFTLRRNTIPLLQYGERGNDVEDGYVALATRDFPTLERPGVSNIGEAMVFGFGLEGVNNNTGFNTRADLLRRPLTGPGTSLRVPSTSRRPTRCFPAGCRSSKRSITSLFDAEGVSYRWDFGDGTAFTNPYPTGTAGHTYEKPGSYLVRVEITNELGQKIIVSRLVRVGYLLFLPRIGK